MVSDAEIPRESYRPVGKTVDGQSSCIIIGDLTDSLLCPNFMALWDAS